MLHLNDLFGVKPKPHEVMSWLVVRSDRFKRFIEELKTNGIVSPDDFTPEVIEEIAGNIIGYRKDPKEKFLADIINGPMDADKLDYLVRDAYFAGPTVVYDLDRFLQTVDAIEYPRDPSLPGDSTKVVRLSVPIEGVTALEQIIISKLMLCSYLYHHHKIRCVEGMYYEVLNRCVELSASGQNTKKQKNKRRLPPLAHPTAFLRLSDRSIFPGDWPPEVEGDPIAGEIVNMLARRELYKRALVMSRLFLPRIDTDERVNGGFERLLACARSTPERNALREEIFRKALEVMKLKRFSEETTALRKRFKPSHVLVDIPRSPTVEETGAVMVRVSSERSEQDEVYVPLTDMFPIEKWVDAYNAIKWRGHVFTIEEAVPFVNRAALDVLSAPPYYLEFTSQATELCKIPDALHGTTSRHELFPK